MLYKILMLSQQLSQSILLPTHPFIQNQMRVRENTGVE